MRSWFMAIAFALLLLAGREASAQTAQTMKICTVTLSPGGTKGYVSISAVQFPNFNCTLNHVGEQFFFFCGTGITQTSGSSCHPTVRYSAAELVGLYQNLLGAMATGVPATVAWDTGANGQAQASTAAFQTPSAQ